jgi:hypothetical protein
MCDTAQDLPAAVVSCCRQPCSGTSQRACVAVSLQLRRDGTPSTA